MREEIIKIIAEILKKDVSEIEAGLDNVCRRRRVWYNF